MKHLKNTVMGFVIAGAAGLMADPVPATVDNPTPIPAPTQVLPLLNVSIDNSTDAINFINTNADPFVYTKVYKLKHADPYELRPYIMSAVQSRKVATNQTKVEAIKYADGTGMLIVSAEQYRFLPLENGMTLDQLVESLDKPNLASESGRKFFVYYPKYFDAATLAKLITEVGTMHALDSTELTGGIDTVKADTSLNAIMFYCTPASEKTIRKILAEYDAPSTEAKITYTIYELSTENDGNIGVDFQAWKNGMGADLFAAGASYISGWPIDALNVKDAHANFINFNPRWNTKFLDFLVARSKAKVVTRGTMSIMNQCVGSIASVTRFPTIGDANTVTEATKSTTTTTKIDPAVGGITTTTTDSSTPETQGKDPAVRVTRNAEFGFTLDLTPEVNGKATIVKVAMNNNNLLGFKSDGSPRISTSTLATKVMVSNSGNTFYIGGLEKSELVRSVNKVPYLGDLPLLGFLFSAESETIKKSQLVAVLTITPMAPDTAVSAEQKKEAESIDARIKAFGIKNKIVDENDYGFDQLLIDADRR